MNTSRGRRRLLTLAVGLLALSPPGAPAKAGVSGVDQRATSFSPKRVEIALGDKVVWTNRSSERHTVTFEDGTDLHPTCDPPLVQLGCQGPDDTAERTFGAPGSYGYYCKIHRQSGMTGVVLVAAPASTTTTTERPSSTSTTQKATSTTAKATSTSTTTTTTRPLATSSTLVPSSTTATTETTSVLLPGEPPPLTDETSSAADKSGDSGDGSGSGTVALIVGLLLAVSAGGGLLLWRLRPGRP